MLVRLASELGERSPAAAQAGQVRTARPDSNARSDPTLTHGALYHIATVPPTFILTKLVGPDEGSFVRVNLLAEHTQPCLLKSTTTC